MKVLMGVVGTLDLMLSLLDGATGHYTFAVLFALFGFYFIYRGLFAD